MSGQIGGGSGWGGLFPVTLCAGHRDLKTANAAAHHFIVCLGARFRGSETDVSLIRLKRAASVGGCDQFNGSLRIVVPESGKYGRK